MRIQIVTRGLLAGILALYVHTPAVRVNAQAKTSSLNPVPSKVDPQKEAQIRELMDVTGARDLGQQLIQAGLEQFRTSVEESSRTIRAQNGSWMHLLQSFKSILIRNL